jgi:hypothetical protein
MGELIPYEVETAPLSNLTINIIILDYLPSLPNYMKMKINLQFTRGLVSNFTQNTSCCVKKTKWLLFHREPIGFNEYFEKHIRRHIQPFPNSPTGLKTASNTAYMMVGAAVSLSSDTLQFALPNF